MKARKAAQSGSLSQTEKRNYMSQFHHVQELKMSPPEFRRTLFGKFKQQYVEIYSIGT